MNNGKQKPKSQPKKTKPKQPPSKKATVAKVLHKLARTTIGNATTAAKVLGYGANAVKIITGSGSYHVRSNTIGTKTGALPMGTEIPKFQNTGSEVRLRHREFIGNVYGTGELRFAINGWDITPANRDMFPFLAGLANQFQEFSFRGLVFEFKSMSSVINQASIAMGTVMLGTNYNANMPVWTDKLEMENSEFSVSARPSESQLHCIECDPKNRTQDFLYIQPQGLAGVNDNRLSSYGKFQLATEGITTTVNDVIGELWVSYDVLLRYPVLNTRFDSFVSTVMYSNTGTPTATNPLGLSPVRLSTSPPAFTIDESGTLLTFSQPGIYMAYIYCSNTGGTVPTLLLDNNANCQLQTLDSMVNSHEMMAAQYINAGVNNTVGVCALVTTGYTDMTAATIRVYQVAGDTAGYLLPKPEAKKLLFHRGGATCDGLEYCQKTESGGIGGSPVHVESGDKGVGGPPVVVDKRIEGYW